MKRIYYLLTGVLGLTFIFAAGLVIVEAAGGPTMDRFHSFWIDLHRASSVGFALFCTFLTAVWGVILGLITDQIMKLTGIDLKSREIVEL